MTRYIEIKNKGQIELYGLILMGACSKNSDQIGFFGTGNKYAIATLMRMKHPFKIFSGLYEVEMSCEEITFRGQIKHRIIVDGESTSLTTEMGPDWEPWFIIREFYSNAMDEGDYSIDIVDEICPEHGYTCIYIELSGPFEAVMKNINRYFVNELHVLETVNTSHGPVRIMSKSDKPFNIYRKGISASPTDEKESLFWYDVQRLDINESRIYKYQFQVRERIGEALAKSTNGEIISNFLLNNRGKFEEDASFTPGNVTFSQKWLEILSEKNLYIRSVVRDSDNDKDRVVLSDELGRAISRQFPELKIRGIKTYNYNFVKIKKDLYLPPESAKEVDLDENIQNEIPSVDEEKRIVGILKPAVEGLIKLGFNLDFSIELIKSENKQSWISDDNVLFLNVNHLDEINYLLVKTALLMMSNEVEISVEFEKFLIDKIVELTTRLRDLNR